MNRAFFSFPRTFEQPVCTGWERSFQVPDVSGRRQNAGARAPSTAPAPGAQQHHHRRQHPPNLPPPLQPTPPAAPSPSPPAHPSAVPAAAQSSPPPAAHPPQPESPSAASHPPSTSSTTMADKELQTITQQLQTALRSNPASASPLLSRAKVTLLKLNALMPSPSTPPAHLLAAREILELGALISIKQQDPDGFTRYFHTLQPFYQLPERVLPRRGSNASKITGLYLLLLLSQGDYAGFHTLLESLEVAQSSRHQQGAGSSSGLEDDEFIQYPVRLEQALMEGSYDRVWGETKSERVPSEEFSVFSNVLVATIRNEIASCSEKAYPSIPITDAKSLLFLDSEGAVIDFAKSRGWSGKDGRIYFPQQEQENLSQEKDVMQLSGQVIENTLGYARELETIV
ncbi:26S proteasome regulatory subunit rpn12 [Lasiodiplodia hormozganensis]|uniref:26S proteasome regulatory subunit rpn12 n=2 Tax=Lasiodiplodia TaxID=66739 RepID=A0AA40D3E0_9PEZI|nr:26S proteasome regulatory subunit rpn12 [Lasiodiplodia hormozganensis]